MMLLLLRLTIPSNAYPTIDMNDMTVNTAKNSTMRMIMPLISANGSIDARLTFAEIVSTIQYIQLAFLIVSLLRSMNLKTVEVTN